MFSFRDELLEKVDEELYGEYDYYISESSEGKILAVVLHFEESEQDLISKMERVGLTYIGIRESRPEDWLKNMITEPFEMIPGVIVDPEDHELEVTDGKIVLKIPQGLAFGTGLHQTTRMCALLLKKYLKPGMEVLDLGCGSGILAILSKKLGAGRVVAVDNDPLAVEVAKENATRNNVEIDVRESDLFSNVDGQFDIIVSNIVAEILIQMLRDAKGFLKQDGLIIVSGIITQKLNLFEGYQIIEQLVMDEWNALVIKI